MKKIFIILVGLLTSATVFACNWDTQDCSATIFSNEIQQKLAALKQNQEWVNKHWDELQRKVQNTDINANTSKTWRARNTVYSNFAGYVYTEYEQMTKKPAQVMPAVVVTAKQDNWLGQCVVVKRSGVSAYTDQNGTAKIAGFNMNASWTVTQANGGKLVGLTTVPDYDKPDPDAGAGKFVGWINKSDLQMQAPRNCN